MNTHLPILEFNGYRCILQNSPYNDRLYGKICTPDNPLEPLESWGFAADTIEEAQKRFELQVEKIISHKLYLQHCKEWQSITDHESIRCVYNILPNQFRKRVESNLFDKSLLTSVVGGDYEVPLYYVTKAWDIILKGTLFPVDFMIGPEEEENCTEEDIKAFLIEKNASRSRCKACRDNDEMKNIWKELFDIDIDKLEIDFLKYNMHLPPNVTDDEYYNHFLDVPEGLDEWVMGRVNYPECDSISYDYVSALMEFTAEILLRRKDEL